MKKLGYILFIALFAAAALAPFVGMLVFGPSPAAANEVLAQTPKAVLEDGSFNSKVLNDASDYLADRFWLRQQLITLDAALEASLLGESASQEVVLGKEDWLFFADTLDDYRAIRQMSPRQCWAAAHTLKLISEYAQTRGARTLFVMVPNKNSVYPEYMPASVPMGAGDRNRDRLFAALEAEGVEALNLLPALLAQKERVQLYQTLDSHWNNLGAALGHDAIVSYLGKTDTAYDPERFTPRRDHSPDLYAMLYPAGGELDVQLYPLWTQDFSYLRPIRSPEDQKINTRSENGTGKLMMFRDSFGNTLHTFMAESYAEACFSRAMPYDLLLPDLEGADTLILEITERHLLWLAQRPPILPAPTREPDLEGARKGESLCLSALDNGNGYKTLSGTLPRTPDWNSPVYLRLGDLTCEASPAGETEADFAAMLPATQSLSEVTVFYWAEGVLCQSEAELRP